MELRHLRYFLAVADELHFGRAARKLHIAQPPLSRQIRDLEEELQVSLFRRAHKRVELTEPGRIFQEKARLILQQTEQARMLMSSASRGAAGQISIGFVTSAVYSVIPDILRRYRKQFPQVDIRCFEMSPLVQLEALRERQIQIGFVRIPVQDASLQLFPISKEKLILAIADDHPLLHRKKTRLRDFASENFIIFPRAQGPGTYDSIVTTCQKAGFSPHIVQEAHEMQTILALVAAGLGVAMVPYSLQHLRRPGVVYREVEEPTSLLELGLAIRKEEESALVRGFVEIATAKKK